LIIRSFYNIGNAKLGNKPIYQALVDLQKPVKAMKKDEIPKILVLEFDISNNDNIDYTILIEDFDENLKYNYLLGRTSGNSPNLSLTSSFQWKVSEKENKKDLFKLNWNKIINIKKNISAEEYPWIVELIEFIENNQDKINNKIKDYFRSENIKEFSYPLIFKIKKDSSGSKYLGEFEECCELYEVLFFIDRIQEKTEGYCQICNNKKEVMTGFNLGFYTTDQDSFKALFFEKRTLTFGKKKKDLIYQYLMCKECYVKTLYGYTIAEAKLKFFLFRVKIGDNSKEIYHYILPLDNEPDEVNLSIEFITKADESSTSSYLVNKIKEIENNLQKLDRKKSKDKYNKLKKLLEVFQEKYRLKELNIIEFIKEIYNTSDKKFNILDIYFRIDDKKQNPPTKTIISEILFTNEKIQKLNQILQNAIKEFSKTEGEFINLHYLHKIDKKFKILEWKDYIHYYTSLFNLEPTSRTVFYKLINHKIRTLLLEKLTQTTDSNSKRYHFENVMRTIKIYDFMMEKGNLWIE